MTPITSDLASRADSYPVRVYLRALRSADAAFMFEDPYEEPIWLIHMFKARGGSGHLLPLRLPGGVRLWTDGDLVAKVYPERLAGEAFREQEMSLTAGRVVPCGIPLGLDIRGRVLVGWWEKLSARLHPPPDATLRWLRRLHDGSYTPLPPAVLVLPLPSPLAVPKWRALKDALSPFISAAERLESELRSLPGTLIHGDANPTNIVSVDGVITGLDFALAGLGPRVIDVATVGVLLSETRKERSLSAALESASVMYGPHPDVTEESLTSAARLVEINRALACLRHESWADEGFARAACLAENRAFVFEIGNGPK